MNPSDSQKRQMFKNLLSSYRPDDIIEGYVKNTLRSFCQEFFGDLYHDKELMNKLYIAGGTIGNLYNFYTTFFPNLGSHSYSQWLKDTDIDIYVNADNLVGLRDIINPILNQYKESIINKSQLENDPKTQNYTVQSWSIDTTNNSLIIVNKVQIVEYRMGYPYTCLATFDFEHCKAHYLIGADKLVISSVQKFLIQRKELIHYEENSADPTIRRGKYLQRGWKLAKDQPVLVTQTVMMDDPIPF